MTSVSVVSLETNPYTAQMVDVLQRENLESDTADVVVNAGWLRSTYSWRVTTYVGKPSAIG